MEVLGDHLDPGLEIDVAIRAHGIPYEWPDEVLREAGTLGEEPAEADKASSGRFARCAFCHHRRRRRAEILMMRCGVKSERVAFSSVSPLPMSRITCR